MTCLEHLRKKAEQESFNRNILHEINQLKQKLQHKAANSRVQGNHHEADKTQETLAYLERVEKCMKRLVEAQNEG